MTEQPQEVGQPRRGDRRGNDRRRVDRRAPLPLWRRPWALVAYGVVGALALVLIFGPESEEREADMGEVVTSSAPPAVDPTAPPAAGAPPRDAYGVGDLERLLAEGERAVGQRVRTELYCGSMDPVALRDEERVNRSVAALADGRGRVPASECRWGSEANAPQVLLLIPPEHAGAFAAAPEVEQSFVRRRRVRAVVEWVGRSEALALRNAAVLRQVL